MALGELPPGPHPLRWVWRVIVFIVGSTVVLIGVALLVLPDPRSSSSRQGSPSWGWSSLSRGVGSASFELG
jgi:hypothetical protein